MTDKPPIKTRVFYGWVMVALAGFTLFFSGPGQTFSVSMYIDSYINNFGWTRSTVSGMYSMGTLAAGMIMGVVGTLFDRYGHRKMGTAVAVLFGIALLYMSTVKTVPMLLLGFFLIRLLGQGSMSLIGTTLVPQWFIKKRGRAISIVSVFGALGMAAMPPINTWMIQNFSWQTGWRVWAVVMWVVVAPTVYFFIRTRPEDVGLSPDNETRVLIDGGVGVAEEVSWTLNEVIRTRAFWMILYTVIIPSAIITGCVFHQISILGQAGLTPEKVALISSVTSLIRLPLVLVAGQLADRIQLRYLLATSQAVLFIMLVSLYFANSVPLVIVYGIFMGVQMALQGIVMGVIWPDYYGRKHLSTIRGTTMMAGVIGSALGPLPYGFAYDVFGGYTEVVIVSMLFPLIGTAFALWAEKPVKMA
ncbi:MAG: MFS transporter [Candidatus Bathyarchaeota archaeon]